MLFNDSKTQFLHLSTQQNLPDNYPLCFDHTHLSSSSTLNILRLSFTKTLKWRSHISSLAKSATKKLGVLCRLHQFISAYQLLTLYRGLICPCMEYTSHVWWAPRTQLLNKVESKVFCLIDSPPLTDCLQPLTLHRNVVSHPIFYHYFHANCSFELVYCMPPRLLASHCLTAQNFLLALIPILSTFLMQGLISIFTLSSLQLVYSGTLYLNLYFHFPSYNLNSFKRGVSRHLQP